MVTARPGRSPWAHETQPFKIYRYNPTARENPRIDTYFVDSTAAPDDPGRAAQDQNEIDPTLTFRRSCREGICGSCSMNIDGVQRAACITASTR
jgi:succinate dehydrogenase / fumarate reductase iron-sulfur subunit